MRRSSLLVVVTLAIVALAGCTALGAQEADPPAGDDSLAADPTVTDPTTDVQGWERGYWHNESLDVDPEDGLTEAELQALVSRAMARVEVVRDVEFDEPVDVELINRSEYSAGGGGDGSTTAAQRAAAAERAAEFEALFVVGETTDAGEAEEATREASVQGYYDTQQDRIVVVSNSDSPRLAELTLGHELVHAYQFRGPLRQTRIPQNISQDGIVALRALIEGDANFAERRYEARCGEEWDCLRRSDWADESSSDSDGGDGGSGGGGGGDAAAGSAGPNVGIYLQSYFPYAAGESMVAGVYERGGWDGVAELYQEPPLSSEQVIHWDSDPEEAESVSVPDRSSDDWERVTAGEPAGRTLGEASLATMFAYTLYDDREGSLVERDAFLRQDGPGPRLTYDLAPSAGWGGDRLYAYRNGDESGYVWRIEWDSSAEAREFASAYRDLLEYHGAGQRDDGRWVVPDGEFADAFSVRVSGETVTIVNGPDRSALSEVHPENSRVTAADVSPAQGAINSTACGTSPPSIASSCS
ncbi:Hvo_1808 family surface protein [Haloarchaeobius litoreus]|uniref:Hvo_1808 family surface protein n=1 Tax=Haloarchaeobius litoreus TaxID=755306 RepID=A0ABD6DLN5_9EURY|nr:Hvo_1808 family surface protein [Haloarchaeobius litoreus]